MGRDPGHGERKILESELQVKFSMESQRNFLERIVKDTCPTQHRDWQHGTGNYKPDLATENM